MKRKKGYILQLIPTDGGTTRSVVISSFFARFLITVFSVCVLIFGFLVYHAISMKEQMEHAKKIANTNLSLSQENAEYRQALDRLDSVRKIQKVISNLTEAFLDDNPDKVIPDEFETLDSLNNSDIDNYVKKIQARLEKVKQTTDNRPSIKPVIGIISRKFGQKVPEDGTEHQGIDIATLLNDPIYSPAPGIVSYVGFKEDLGNTLTIDHGGGITTLYGHLNRVSVKVGEIVKRGQTIGVVGMTGNTTGPHLHYEVLTNNIHQNPEDFFY